MSAKEVFEVADFEFEIKSFNVAAKVFQKNIQVYLKINMQLFLRLLTWNKMAETLF